MRRASLESRIALAIVMGGTPAVLLGALHLAFPGIVPTLLWVLWLLSAAWLVAFAWYLRRRLVGPLQSLANIIESIRYEDYGLRARTDRGGALAELATEVNLLAEYLRERAREEQESRALLEKVMQEIDLPLFAFDADERLVTSNPAAWRLLGATLRTGTTARTLGLDDLLRRSGRSPVDLVMPGGSGRYVVRRRTFRMEGRPHRLLVLAEVSGALHAERQEAWQGLVRVLGHEINNSLAPIQSIADTLRDITCRPDREVPREEFAEGLGRIAERARALGRFVGGYAALARLPEPRRQRLEIGSLAGRVAAMEPRIEVALDGDPAEIAADPDQVEQALINLVKNAADNVEAGSGSVTVRWSAEAGGVRIDVLDDGPGPPDSENLFVPFFTTKPGGSGIGLLLARRIAELHGGWLTLEAREDGMRGAEARLWLPRDDDAGLDRP